MGNASNSNSNQQPRHQAPERHQAQYESGGDGHKRRQAAADHQKYYVCRAYGRSCGFRTWQCVNRQMTLDEATEWIKNKVATDEAAIGSGRRTWESPYLYQMLQVQDPNELTYMLGQAPMFVD